MPTYTLFHSIDLCFRHLSETSWNNAKRICNQNDPLRILLDFRYKLGREDSTYYKHLKLFNFKSKYANLLLKKFEGVVTKLVFSYGFCHTVLEDNTEKSTKHMEETVISVLTLIQEQRREVPNKLTPDMIVRHLSEYNFNNCSAEPNFLSNKCNLYLNCSVPVFVSF